MVICHCGSNKNADVCCLRYFNAEQLPDSPEALMRSRYTAYCLNRLDYIEKTMCGAAAKLYETSFKTSKRTHFIKLEVLSATQTATTGEVEFQAYYIENNKLGILHEVSQFEFIDDKWYYSDGKILPVKDFPKAIGRNDPCPCASGIKYKKCCAMKTE